jgi:hypothetical protein
MYWSSDNTKPVNDDNLLLLYAEQGNTDGDYDDSQEIAYITLQTDSGADIGQVQNLYENIGYVLNDSDPILDASRNRVLINLDTPTSGGGGTTSDVNILSIASTVDLKINNDSLTKMSYYDAGASGTYLKAILPELTAVSNSAFTNMTFNSDKSLKVIQTNSSTSYIFGSTEFSSLDIGGHTNGMNIIPFNVQAVFGVATISGMSLGVSLLIEYSADNKQVNVLDQRFYRRDGKYYPSITSILNYFPKNQFFHSWLKDVGHNSDIIAAKAAAEGTQVHNASEKLMLGEEIHWMDENGKVHYSLDVWKMILKFADFWNQTKPELVATEYHLFSDEYQYAGTTDIICRMNGKLWLIDIKTSNSIHTSYNLQLAAYAKAWNETHNEPIEGVAILWLKASTRGEKKDKIQGKGWELKVIENINDNFDMFIKVYDIYRLENPDAKPSTETLPISIKI